MNALATAPQAESKDIKLSTKKVADSKSEEGKDFFENIIVGLLNENDDSENKSFLLSKLLNLSSEFEKKEEALSNFSDAPLFNDNQIGQVSIQELLKIATMIKDGKEPANFPTDSKTLKLALLKPDVKEGFKNAKTIKDLITIAKTNNIEIKNFQFFKEEAALNPKDKKMVQKIKSEEIFKLIEKQIDTKAKLNSITINNPKEAIKQIDTKTSILQTVLASKEIVKPLENRSKQSTKISKDNNIKNSKINVEQNREVKTYNPKVEEKNTKVEQNREIKTHNQNIESENKKIVELKTTQAEQINKKIVKNQLQTNIQKTDNSIDIKNTPIKPEITSEKVEIETQSTDKTTIATETKTQNIEKVKHTPEIKRTFNTFAQEFKEKVENYKPPLMKIKMELKPTGLGEVDVTLINRGNNLQVNINSNSSTIAMFVQNQAEFKNSLVNMGFSDLQMNFSEQQQKEQDAQNQKNGKNVFEHFEEDEEQDGFEMIIPRYV